MKNNRFATFPLLFMLLVSFIAVIAFVVDSSPSTPVNTAENIGAGITRGPMIDHPELAAGYDQVTWQRLAMTNGQVNADNKIFGAISGDTVTMGDGTSFDLNDEKQVKEFTAYNQPMLFWREGQKVWVAIPTKD